MTIYHTIWQYLDNIRSTKAFQLQHFLPYMNLAPKNCYWREIWLSNIIKHCQGNCWGGWARQRQHIWKTTFGERWPSVEEYHCWKTTFGGRLFLVEDILQWKMKFGGRQPFVEDNLWWWLPPTVTAKVSPSWNCYNLFQLEIEFSIVEKCMRHCSWTCVQKKRHFSAKITKLLNYRSLEGRRIIGPIMNHSF